MYPFLVILKFLNGSSLDNILDKLNLFSVHLAHFEVFICKISIHCLIHFMVLNYSDWFSLNIFITSFNIQYINKLLNTNYMIRTKAQVLIESFS